MLSVIFGALLLASPTVVEPSADSFASIAEDHLRRALAGERPLEEFEDAHKNFDAAFLVAEDARYLCRALAVADLALVRLTFADEQARLSWEETRRDDLERLRADAAETRRGNCRFDAMGRPPRMRVASLVVDDPASVQDQNVAPPTAETHLPASVPAVERAPALRRSRAYAVSGGLLTMTGLGLLGATVGVVGVELQRAADMRGMIAAARAEQRKFTQAEDQRFNSLAGDLLRGRDVVIGVGVAGVVTLAAGVAVLVKRRQLMRGYALLPYGGPHGVGAHLRLKF